MKLITNTLINSLPISYAEYVKWAEDAFKLKQQTILPPKISIKLEQNIFFNTMPCYLPFYKRIGVKMVSRYPKRIPSLISEILLWDSETGECLALMSGDWITAFRTGAVASLTIKITGNQYRHICFCWIRKHSAINFTMFAFYTT